MDRMWFLYAFLVSRFALNILCSVRRALVTLLGGFLIVVGDGCT